MAFVLRRTLPITALVVFAHLQAQSLPGHANPDAAFRAGTQEILLDFVARDKHHNEVKNLHPEDVEVYEDGVRQTLKSFHYRSGEEPASASAVPPAPVNGATFDPLSEINIVSIIFESMGPTSRLRATQLIQEFLQTEIQKNTWIGVFTLNHRLSVIQPYTTDLALLRKAVNRAGTGAYQEFAKENVDIIKNLNSLQAGITQGAGAQFQPIQPGSAEERGPAGGDQALNAALIKMNELTLKTLIQQVGYRSIDALRTLVREQARLPGRKTVLYVSEGLVVPPDRPELLRDLISEANRGNISFYTLDARGLDTTSSTQIAQKTTAAILDADNDQGGAHVQQTDLQQNARELASGTGGFAMDNSNDLRAPLRRVMEDVRSHYEVTYSPSTTKYDGRFRALEVKVDRPGVTVQGRRGYFALPIVSGETLAPFEVAALNALNANPSPRAFPYHTAAFRFDTDSDGVRYEVAFSVPSRELKLSIDDTARVFNLHVSFVGVVKNDQGEIVQIVRRDLPFRAPLDKRAEFEAGEVTAIVPIRLKTGRYRLEAVALDREANSVSVRKSALIVPSANSPSLGLSDFIWVRSIAPAGNDRDAADPLESVDGRITPELDPSFNKSASAPFYFVVWSAAPAVKPAATITVASDGKTLAALHLSTPAPDSGGAYRFAGRIPLTSFEPGQYELVVTISQGATTSLDQSLFSVQ